MSNSKLICYTKLSPNCNKPRNHKIDTITIHHMAGNLTVEQCGDVFASTSRQASSNYGIGSDGRIALYVDEANRSWCSSNAANDHRAITIEVANDKPSDAGGWHVSDKAIASLIALCVDICQRNGIAKLNYTGNTSGNLTMHRWFAATACPGPYLASKFPYIADEVNKRLNNTTANSSGSTIESPASGLEAGAKISLTNVALYASADAKTKSSSKTGTFYVWSKDIVNGRIRITNSMANVGKTGQVTGWIAKTDARAVGTQTFNDYKVKITVDALNIRSGAGVNNQIVGCIQDKGTYTITDEKTVSGQVWGKLKSGAGWICLTGYTKKV